METNSQPHGLQLRSQPTSVKKPELVCEYQSKLHVEALRLQNQGASSPTPYLRNQLNQKEMFSQDIEQMIQKQRNIQNKADRHKDQEMQAFRAMEMNQLKQNPRSAKKQIQFENQMSSMTKVFANKSGASLQSKLQIENHGSKFDNENSLKDNLILTALDVITKKVDENITLPKALEQNKYIWSKAFIKNKALQDIINNYTSQITMLMKKELKNNSQYMTDFMKMTRAPDNTLNSAKAFIDASQNRESGRNRLNKPSTHRGIPSQKLSGPASMSSDQPRHHENKTFETVKTSEGDEIDKAQVKPIISFHEIARSIRNHHAMYLRAKKSFIPEGLDKDLVPTDEWIHELCHGYELQTFFHKKNALEEIKQKIDSEIERRRNVQLMNQNIERITLQFEDLDKQTNFFTENDLQAKTPQDFVIQQYKVLCNVDRSKAERLLSPKAPEYMCEWGLETVADHTHTLNKWKDTWQTNQQFEKGIMDEMRWYKMDMLSIERQHRNNISIAKQRSFFYIEALELSLNEQKLKYQKEVNELRMELEDYRSYKLRAFIEDQEDGGNTFIDQYINSKWQYQTVKEANKFNEKLRTEVRNLYQSNKHLKHDFMALRNEHQRAEEKIFKLEDENAAKNQYFDYITKIVEQGSDPGLPKMYIDSNDDRKKFNIYSKEKLYGSHLKLIEDSKILKKIQGELSQAKVFSIINYGLHEIIQKVGILKSNPETIRHEGFKKFRFSNEQLLQIYYLFKTPLVRDELFKLNRHKLELQKFGNAFIAGEKDRQANVKVQGETLSTNDPAVRIEERFRKMTQDDMVVLKSQMKEVISAMNIIPDYKAKFLQIGTSNELVYDFNVMVDKESMPLGSAAIDNPEGPRAQLPIIVNNMEIFDTVIITEDRQIIIDNKKFVLFLFDKKNLLDRNKDSQGLLQLWRDVGAFLQSVFSANKLITGVLESTKTYLKEYTPRNLIGREVQVGDSDQSGKVGMDQAQYEELMKMQAQQLEAQNKKKNVGKMDKKALEKELQNQFDIIEMLKKKIADLEQELQRKKTASTQKVVVPLHDLDKHQSSIEQSEIFQQDLVELFKGLVIYGKDQNLKKFHKVKDSLSGSDMLNINLMQLGVDSMLQGQNLETIQQRISQITNEDVFGQQTVGEFVMLGLCQTMQDIIMDKQSGGTYLRNRSRLQGGPKAENEIQTSIDKDKMQGLLMSNDQLTEIKRENESLQTKVRTILENQCDCMKNSTFRISGQKRVSTKNFIPDEMEKQASQQYSIDMILASAQNMDLNKKSANISQAETPIEQDLLLHEIFNEMNMDDILNQQNSELFTPQKKMKAELYNKIRFKLDKFEKVTKTLRQKQLDDATNNKDESVYAYDQEATKQVINIQENSDARLKTGPAKRKSTGGRNNWNERAVTGKLLDFMDFEKYYCLDEGDANNKLLSVRRNVIQKNEEVALQTFNASNQFVPLSHRTSKHTTQTKVSKRWEYLKSRKRSADILAQKAARSRQLMNTCQVVFKRMNKNAKKPVLGARKVIEVPEAEFDPAGTYRSLEEVDRLLSKRKTEITVNLQSEHQDTDYVCSGQSSPLTPYEKAQGANDNSCILDIIAAEAMGNQQNYVQQNITQQFDDLQDVSKIDMQPSQTMESQYFQNNNRNINMQGHLQEQDSSLELQQSGSNREEAKNSTRQRSQNVKVVVYKNASHMKQSMTALEQDLDMVVSPELKQVKETNEGIQSNQVTTYEGRTYGQEMDIRDPAYSGMISGRDDEMRDSQPRYFPGDPMDQEDNKPEGLQDMELLEQLINESDTNQSSKGKLKSGAADTIIPLSDMEHTDNHGSLPMSNSDRYIDVDQMQEVKTGIKKVRNMIQSAHQKAAPNQRNKIYQLASQNQKKLMMKRNQADQNLSSHVIMGHRFTQQRMEQNQSGNMIEMSCQTNMIEDQQEMVHIPGAMGLMKQKGRATTAVARVGKSLPRPSRMHQGSLATTLQVDVGGYLTTQASKNPKEGSATLGVQNGQRSNLRYVNFTPSIQSKNPKELGINPRMFQGDHQFLRVGQHKDVQNAQALTSFLKVEGSSEIARSVKQTRNQQAHTQQKYSMSRLDQRKQSVYNDLKNKRKYSTNDRERIKSILKQNDVL